MPADLNPLSSQLINTGKCMCVWECVCVWREGGSVCVAPNKDQKHSDITSACLTPPWPPNLCTCLYLILDPVIL